MVAIEKVALALSDPIRVKILDLLVAGRNEVCCSPDNPETPVGMCSCDLLPTLELAPSRLSYHLAQLKEAGLISEQKRGKWIYYSLNCEVLTEFRQALEDRFCAPFRRTAADCGCAPAFVPVKTALE